MGARAKRGEAAATAAGRRACAGVGAAGYLRSIIQDLEAANEGCSRPTGVLSSRRAGMPNEEELITAKNCNHQRDTVNEELNARNEELSRATSLVSQRGAGGHRHRVERFAYSPLRHQSRSESDSEQLSAGRGRHQAFDRRAGYRGLAREAIEPCRSGVRRIAPGDLSSARAPLKTRRTASTARSGVQPLSAKTRVMRVSELSIPMLKRTNRSAALERPCRGRGEADGSHARLEQVVVDTLLHDHAPLGFATLNDRCPSRHRRLGIVGVQRRRASATAVVPSTARAASCWLSSSADDRRACA